MIEKYKFLDIVEELEIVHALMNANANMINNAFGRDIDPIKIKNNVINAYELSIMDLLKYDQKNSTKPNDKKLQKICAECLKLLINTKIPEMISDKIPHTIKIITYGYLSEQWNIVRQFLIDNNMKHDAYEQDNWIDQVLIKVYYSILYITRKSEFDFQKIDELIHELKTDQKYKETQYMESILEENTESTSAHLLSLYYVLDMVVMLKQYMMTGEPDNVQIILYDYFKIIRKYSEISGNINLNIIIHLLYHIFKKMINNSIWNILEIDSNFKQFIEKKLKTKEAIFELLYPQIESLTSKNMNISNKALVINLPTSSGKTLIAEFKIIQMYKKEAHGIAVYVVPTKALVNQISKILKNDLSSLYIKIAKIQGIRSIDNFENSIIKNMGFNVLVTTPEKLNLLIRQNNIFAESIRLCIIDEAHNISNKQRGLSLELLLTTIKKDYPEINFLLLTPFIENGENIAKWLSSDQSAHASIKINWKPNDKIVGSFTNMGGNTITEFTPLETRYGTLTSKYDEKIKMNNIDHLKKIYKFDKLYLKSALLAAQFEFDRPIILVCSSIDIAWSTADVLYNMFNITKNTLDFYNSNNFNIKISKNVKLIQKYLSAEFGTSFPLINYLGKGIGIHHAGLSEDIIKLMEKLFIDGELHILVSTTTISQGINFPTSVILLSNMYHGATLMKTDEFWNLAGRTGRINQKSLGIVGIASEPNESSKKKVAKFVKRKNTKIESVMPVILSTLNKNDNDLRILSENSGLMSFIQYITHIKNQSETPEIFEQDIEKNLSETFGYNKLDIDAKKQLKEAVSIYGKNLYDHNDTSELSDQTGFSSDTIDIIKEKLHGVNTIIDELDSEIDIINSFEIMDTFVKIMKDMPEINDDLKNKHIDDVVLNKILYDWINNDKIINISKKYFKNDVKNCVSAIYQNVRNSASWGISGISKTFDHDATIENENKLKNLSAKMYYGVKTDEALLMSMLEMPRILATKMGKKYSLEFQNNMSNFTNLDDVEIWVNELTDHDWDEMGDDNITGRQYHEIWKLITNTY